jgi:hypothetical protein
MIKTFDEITGKTAFLEGHKGLPRDLEEFYNYLISINKPVILIENLYDDPAKITQIQSCQNLCFYTTGMFLRELNELVMQFDRLNYVPVNVFFADDRNPQLFRTHVKKLSGLGTKFYLLDVFGKELEALR